MIYAIVTLIAVACIAPYIYVISVSLTDPKVYVPYKFYIIPEKASLRAYSYILANKSFLLSLKSTAFITVTGTVLNILFTFSMAYGLTKKNMPHRNLCMGLVIFTLLVQPGYCSELPPGQGIGLMNSYWALILPSLTMHGV